MKIFYIFVLLMLLAGCDAKKRKHHEKKINLSGFDIYMELPNSGGRVPLQLKRLPRDFIELLPEKVLSWLEEYVAHALTTGPPKPKPQLNPFNGTGNVEYVRSQIYTPPARVH